MEILFSSPSTTLLPWASRMESYGVVEAQGQREEGGEDFTGFYIMPVVLLTLTPQSSVVEVLCRRLNVKW